jgi:hypothetical protein
MAAPKERSTMAAAAQKPTMAAAAEEPTTGVDARRSRRFWARLTPLLAMATAVALAGVCDDIGSTIK